MIDRRALLNQPFSQPDSPHSQQQQHQAEMGAAEGAAAGEGADVACALSAIQLASAADDTLLGPMALAISTFIPDGESVFSIRVFRHFI